MMLNKKRLLLFFVTVCVLIILLLIIILSNNILQKKYNVNRTDQLLIEESFNSALIYYPELEGTKIFLKYRELNKRTMNTRPKTNFIFLPKEKREYIIIINTNYKNNALTILNYTSSAKIGIFGHELAHIADYKEKTTAEMIIFGAKYIFLKSYKQAVEKKTDQIAISHGLGVKLYESTLFQYNYFDYWKDKEDIYYGPQDILILMNATN